MVHPTDCRDEISCTTSRPAQSRNAAALCTDANYLPYALFVAKQLHDLHDMESLDIVLCVTDDCVIPESLAYLNLRICRIDAGTLFSELYLDPRRTEAVYHRLAMPNLFREGYDRILYLDCDVFIQGGEFSRLFTIEMGGRPIAAVRDMLQWVHPDRKVRAFADLGLPQGRYLNSGVMLIDVEAYLSTRMLERCLALAKEHAGKFHQHDQQLINGVLQGDWVEISPMWNWQRSGAMPYSGVMLPINIVHFIGPRKPWKDIDDRVAPRFKQPLNAFLQRQFPDHPLISIKAAPVVASHSVLKHAWDIARRSRGMARYIARFPDDLVAVD